MRSIVRRDDGKGYEEWLEEVARASGIETPTRQDLAKLDRKRPKKGSNREWAHPHDPEARITKMKDGRTGLAHKFEQAVDMETGAVVAVTVQTMEGGDTALAAEHAGRAQRQLAEIEVEPREVVADKGYHSNQTMTGVQDRGLRSYVSEPNRGRRKWKRNRDAQKPTYDNRRRIQGNRGKELLRQRGEKVERGFAHLLVTGGLRRVHVRGREEIRKRILIRPPPSTSGFSCASGTALAPRAVCRASPRRKRRLACHVSTAVLHMIRLSCRPFGLLGPIVASSGRNTRRSHKVSPASVLIPLTHPAACNPLSSTVC